MSNLTWKKVKETNLVEYWVSDGGTCRVVDKRTGDINESDGYYNKYIGYMWFAGDYVHRHVAKAFIDKPAGADYVDHLNNDRLDNRVQNLAWITRKANNRKEHARKLKRLNAFSKRHDGEIIKATKDDEVQFFKNGHEVARFIGCSHVLVYNCLNGRLSAKRAKGWTLKWIDVKNATLSE